MKKMLLFFTFLLPTYCLAAPTEDINVKNNSNFEIKLPSNPTTGFGWMVKTIPANVILTGMRYKDSDGCKGAVGCGGGRDALF
ncbi:Proteinase inhibitor I42, chagasin [Zymomonas mobilis subsp. mobilis ATCC 29191]|uniref:protease inhibitor I42 family protein n=1 Tax=Zymomonas mobilis TaxID=542 RepID=UPI00026D8669|nr:protease inhibitor I42 family protein [Zymomonas mobilis]AFN57238.1 Proteinase inhibitor I42, chagasin [Zymomonas mobilis subsp. mobilis ATCC 29191]GEB88131.1 hypothetical protein ZMO01_14710 [Zymomonas mobilis subsp. mobilis]